MSDEIIWMSRDVVASLKAEASLRAPQETGGVLLGYWAAEGGDPVVTHGVGPGPNAVHSTDRFVPDHEYHIEEIARLYEESDRQLQYLGDWHSHPNGAGTLSNLDHTCLRRIGRSPEARVENPIMLILAGSPEWELFAWRFGVKRTWFWWQQAVTSLAIREFEGL